MIFVKIVKIGQLQMGVESREPMIHSGFFRLKRTFIISKQKKNTIWKVYARGTILSINSQVSMAKKFPKYAGAGRVQTIKKFSSHNHIENFALIILGRFPINKTLKTTILDHF